MTLQEQYNLIKEGKGAKDVFVKHAKQLFPHLVPNHYGFESAATILTQRGIISENLWGIATGNNKQPDWFKLFEDYTASTEEKDTKANATKSSKEVDEYKDKSYHNQYEAETGDDVIFDQYLNGIQIEVCKPENAGKTVDELKKVVLKNLKKDKLYYTKNAAFGIEGIGYTDEAPGLGKTKEVKGKYASSGMEPVKINEGFNEDKIARYKKYTYTLDGKTVTPDDINFYDNLLGAELDGKVYKMGIPDEKGNVELKLPKGKTGTYTESLDEIGMFHDPRTSASFKDDDDKWENGAFHVRFRMLKNKGIDADKAKELAATYEDKSWEEVKKLLELNESQMAMLGGETPYGRYEMVKNIVEPNLGKNYKTYIMFDEPKGEYDMMKTKYASNTENWKDLYRSSNYQGYAKISPDGNVIRATILDKGGIVGAIYVKDSIQESKLRSALRQLIKEELNLKEIDQIGEEAAKGAKVKKINDEINKRKKKIKALETLKELEDDSINPKKLKELYSEIKKLEAAKNKLEKKGKKKEQLVDEITVVDKTTTSDEIADIAKQEKTTPAAVKKAVDTAKSSGEPVNVA